MRKSPYRSRGLTAILVLMVLFVSVGYSADLYREQRAQDLVKAAEVELAMGNTQNSILITDFILAQYADTRAKYKAGQIKELALADASAGEASGTAQSSVRPPRPASACLWGIIPGGGQFYMADYHRRAANKNRMWTDIAVGGFALAGTPVAGVSSLVFLGQSQDPLIDECCISNCLLYVFEDDCVNVDNYQTACLVLGILTAAGVPLLWGGSAGLAYSEAKMTSAPDTLTLPSPADTTDAKPSFIRRCLFGKKGSW